MLDEGLQLAVATARSPATVVELLRPLGLRTPAVLMTGTMIYDVAHTRCLAATPLARETAAAVCAVLERTARRRLLTASKAAICMCITKNSPAILSGRSFPAASIRRIRPLCRWNTIPKRLRAATR